MAEADDTALVEPVAGLGASDVAAADGAAGSKYVCDPRDVDTLYAMGSIYCRGHHAGAKRNERGVCSECAGVIDYSLYRTSVCPHEHKGTCKQCTIHCYKPEMRAAIREIMRYGAPRMIYQHPVLTAYYLRKKLSERN